ncbi:MAG: hypothetical protein AAFN11_10880 [Chloroflexota bacterium]
MGILLVLVACQDTVGGACAEVPSLEVSRWPVVLRVDQNGNIDLSLMAEIGTRFGAIAIGDPIPLVRNDRVLMIIENRNLPEHQQRTIYCINMGRSMRVTTNGTTVIDVSSRGYVLIDVTDADVDSIEIYDGNIVEFDGASNAPLCGGRLSGFMSGDQAQVDIDTTSSEPRPKLYLDYTHYGDPNQGLAFMRDGDVLTLVDGPYCHRDRWFWQVESTIFASDTRGLDVWAQETGSLEVYFCPIGVAAC